MENKIIVYRAEHNLSQDAFAELCNISRCTVRKAETNFDGLTKLSKFKIIRIISK